MSSPIERYHVRIVVAPFWTAVLNRPFRSGSDSPRKYQCLILTRSRLLLRPNSPLRLNAGALSSLGAREMYENALLMIETRQDSEPGMKRVYEQCCKQVQVCACENATASVWRAFPSVS